MHRVRQPRRCFYLPDFLVPATLSFLSPFGDRVTGTLFDELRDDAMPRHGRTNIALLPLDLRGKSGATGAETPVAPDHNATCIGGSHHGYQRLYPLRLVWARGSVAHCFRSPRPSLQENENIRSIESAGKHALPSDLRSQSV